MLAPRLGVARATRFAAFGFALAMLGPGLAPDLPLLIAAAFALGLTNGALDVSMNGLASDIETRWGAPIMSSFHAAFSLGGLGGAALGAAMATRSSPWISAMSLVAIVNIAFVLRWHGARCTIPRPRRKPSRRASLGPAARRFGFAAASRSACLCEGAIGDWSGVYLANDLSALAFARGGRLRLHFPPR